MPISRLERGTRYVALVVALLTSACPGNTLGIRGLRGNQTEPAAEETYSSAASGQETAPPVTPERHLSVPEVARLAKASLVEVFAESSFGTGFCISKRGWVVTNFHVVEGAEGIVVRDPDGRTHQVRAVLGSDRANDLVILEAPTLLLPALSIATGLPEPGESVVVVGHPRQLTATVSDGLVSAVRHMSSGVSILQFTAPISPGSSGGPLLNSDGHVVGVVVATRLEAQNVNFASTSGALASLATAGQRAVPVFVFGPASRAPSSAPTSAPTGPSRSASASRPAFPPSVAGFGFGTALREANSLCSEQRGHETILWLRSNQNEAECPFLPVDVPFAVASVKIWFTAGQLSSVLLYAKSFTDARQRLVGKYGEPDLVMSFNPNTKTWAEAERWQIGDPGAAKWFLEGGNVTVASLDGETVVVHYESQAAQILESQNY